MGKVIVVLSVPAKVKVLETVKVLLAPKVKVPVPVVRVLPLKVVAAILPTTCKAFVPGLVVPIPTFPAMVELPVPEIVSTPLVEVILPDPE